MLTSAKAWSALWDAAEFGGYLNPSPTLFVNHPSCVACITLVTIKNFNVKK
jgi:hypothetical protein